MLTSTNRQLSSGEICVQPDGINLSSAPDKGEETPLIYMVK